MSLPFPVILGREGTVEVVEAGSNVSNFKRGEQMRLAET